MAKYDFPPYYISAYGLAVRQGFEGTLDEWLESLKGVKGDRIELRSMGKLVQWRTVSFDGTTGAWQDLFVANGAIELRTLENVVQWRWVAAGSTGEDAWQDLYTITDAGVVPDVSIESVVQAYMEQVPRVAGFDVIRSGQTITVKVTLEDDQIQNHVIALDEQDYPTSITSNGLTAPVTWEGFE